MWHTSREFSSSHSCSREYFFSKSLDTSPEHSNILVLESTTRVHNWLRIASHCYDKFEMQDIIKQTEYQAKSYCQAAEPHRHAAESHHPEAEPLHERVHNHDDVLSTIKTTLNAHPLDRPFVENKSYRMYQGEYRRGDSLIVQR
jgi:hypothetical protein